MILTLSVGLALDCPTRAACTVANRAASLNYKLGDYAVKCQSVIKARLGKFYKVFYGDTLTHIEEGISEERLNELLHREFKLFD